MKISDNKVATLFAYLLEGLKAEYESREAVNIAQLLFDFHLSFSRVDLVLKADETLTESEILKLHHSLKRLKAGEPVQYVIGECEFYGLTFQVDKSVLIPRPETEELVSWILEENKKEDIRILDIGTGSGCIPLALKSRLPKAEISATDVSKTALNMARLNADKNELEVNFYNNNVLEEFLPVSKLDVIISNPPYISDNERDELNNRVVDNEPALALFVRDNDPLIFYRRISALAFDALLPSAKIYFEVHEKYAQEVCGILEETGFTKIVCKKDFQGKERMLRAVKL